MKLIKRIREWKNCSKCGGSDGAHVPGCPNDK
jgi:hypothetical protein